MSTHGKIIFVLIVMLTFGLLTGLEVEKVAFANQKLQNEAQPLKNLEIGDRVADKSWEWEHKLGVNYSDKNEDNEQLPEGEVKPVTWIVVAKDHYEEGGITLLSEELIGNHAYDDSYDRTEKRDEGGSSHWGESGTTDAEHGLRPWLNSTDLHEGEGFYQAFSESFQNRIITTTVPHKKWEDGDFYTTKDKIFVPSTTELGDTSHRRTYEIGEAFSYFDGAGSDERRAKLKGSGEAYDKDSDYNIYWTRSPSDWSPRGVHDVLPGGSFQESILQAKASIAAYSDVGVRPVLNLEHNTPVSKSPNKDGIYEIGGKLIEKEETFDFKVAYIPVDFEDESAERDIEQMERRAYLLEKYFYEQSYGNVNIGHEFIFDDWVNLLEPYDYYEDQWDGSQREFNIFDDAVKFAEDKRDFNQEDYDCTLVIRSDTISRHSFRNMTSYARMNVDHEDHNVEKVSGGGQAITSEETSYAVWAHEIGHAIFGWFDYYDSAPNSMGDILNWGLMGKGPSLNPSSPIMAYNKVEAGWMDYKDISSGEEIEFLHEPGDEEYAYKYIPDKEEGDYFILEKRQPEVEQTIEDPFFDPPWYRSEILSYEGVNIYKVEKKDAVVGEDEKGEDLIYENAPHVNYALPQSVKWWHGYFNPLKDIEQELRVTLSPEYTGDVDEYEDVPGETKFVARKEDSNLKLEIKDLSVKNRSTIVLDNIVFNHKDMPTHAFEDDEIWQLGINLQVFTEDGHMVGYDHETGVFRKEIEGVKASGPTAGGGSEWISVPLDEEINYKIDTTPASQWMEEAKLDEMDIEADLQQIDVDEEGERTVTKETKIIELNDEDDLEEPEEVKEPDIQEKLELNIGKSQVRHKEGDDFKDSWHLDTVPVIEEDRTLMPIRGVIDEFGSSLDWDGDIQQVTIERKDVEIIMTIGEKTAIVNGEEVEMDIAPTIRDARTLLPLRFVNEQLGHNVEWIGEEEKIICFKGIPFAK